MERYIPYILHLSEFIAPNLNKKFIILLEEVL